MISDLIFDPARICPDCSEGGGLRFTENPPSTRQWTDGEGCQHVVHEAITRDYECHNCSCTFTLTSWGHA